MQIYTWILIKCKQRDDCKQTAESKQIAITRSWQSQSWNGSQADFKQTAITRSWWSQTQI